MKQYQLVSATFKPVLPIEKEFERCIGKRFYFEKQWLITPEDNSNFIGQYAWRPIDINTEQSLFGWCPCEDLKNVFKY